MFIVPLTVLAIFFVLFLVFHSLKWASIIMVSMAFSPPFGSPTIQPTAPP